MQKSIWVLLAILMVACMKTIPEVKIAEESMVQNCEYIETLSETLDPGVLFSTYQSQAARNKILKRAANLRATHIVWVYDNRMGSAAVAYRCDRR